MRWKIGLLLSLLPAVLWGKCICPNTTADEQRERATQIFTGPVIDVAKDKKTGRQIITFGTDESYKGDPPDTVSAMDQEAGTDCAMNFKVDESYVVFTRWIWGDIFTSQCFGTKKEELKTVEPLGPADSAKDEMYPMLEKACMGHHAVGCCLDSVKAMSQGHYLPIPKDGCPDDMLPDRLKCYTSYTWCIPSSESEHRHK